MMKLVVWFAASVLAGTACGGGASVTDAGAIDAPRGKPIGFTFQAIGERSFASFGWSGQVHNLRVPDGTPFGVKVINCSGTGDSDGLCSFEGPVEPNLKINPVQRRRCLNQMAKPCTADADCPDQPAAHKRCVHIYDPPTGAPLPGASGLGACGWSYIPVAPPNMPPTIKGTLDLASGELNLQNVTIFLPLNGGPGTYRGSCMECVGDPIANDGVKGGRCMTPKATQTYDRGPDFGMPCDTHRFGTLPGFEGSYSMDCAPTTTAQDAPPNIFGGTFTSAGVVRNISESSPDCTDPRFAGAKCFCGVCPKTDPAMPAFLQTPCLSDDMCGGAKCGALPANCNLNPPRYRSDGTLNPLHDPAFFDNQCRGAGVTDQFATAGDACIDDCVWDPVAALGACQTWVPNPTDPTKSVRVGIRCYPHGLGTKIEAPGRHDKQNGIYFADTGTAVCTQAIDPPVNAQLGLPGLTFQKRSFRIVPEYAP